MKIFAADGTDKLYGTSSILGFLKKRMESRVTKLIINMGGAVESMLEGRPGKTYPKL
jgi:hypothetical protein